MTRQKVSPLGTVKKTETLWKITPDGLFIRITRTHTVCGHHSIYGEPRYDRCGVQEEHSEPMNFRAAAMLQSTGWLSWLNAFVFGHGSVTFVSA